MKLEDVASVPIPATMDSALRDAKKILENLEKLTGSKPPGYRLDNPLGNPAKPIRQFGTCIINRRKIW